MMSGRGWAGPAIQAAWESRDRCSAPDRPEEPSKGARILEAPENPGNRKYPVACANAKGQVLLTGPRAKGSGPLTAPLAGLRREGKPMGEPARDSPRRRQPHRRLRRQGWRLPNPSLTFAYSGPSPALRPARGIAAQIRPSPATPWIQPTLRETKSRPVTDGLNDLRSPLPTPARRPRDKATRGPCSRSAGPRRARPPRNTASASASFSSARTSPMDRSSRASETFRIPARLRSQPGQPGKRR